MQHTTNQRGAVRHSPTLLRWLTLIEQHGGQAAAIAALLRQADDLERLERALRARGLSAELLRSEMQTAGTRQARSARRQASL